MVSLARFALRPPLISSPLQASGYAIRKQKEKDIDHWNKGKWGQHLNDGVLVTLEKKIQTRIRPF
jgi:hypothetical protein